RHRRAVQAAERAVAGGAPPAAARGLEGKTGADGGGEGAFLDGAEVVAEIGNRQGIELVEDGARGLLGGAEGQQTGAAGGMGGFPVHRPEYARRQQLLRHLPLVVKDLAAEI